MPGKAIRSVQCHLKVGSLFRKRIWSILTKEHSIESGKGRVVAWKFRIHVASSVIFVTLCLEEWRGFLVFFGNNFSRFSACLSVCNRKAISMREVVIVPKSPTWGFVRTDSQMSAESRVTDSLGLRPCVSLCLPTTRLPSCRKGLSFSTCGWESEEGKLLTVREKGDGWAAIQTQTWHADWCSFWDFCEWKDPWLACWELASNHYCSLLALSRPL